MYYRKMFNKTTNPPKGLWTTNIMRNVDLSGLSIMSVTTNKNNDTVNAP